MTHKILAAKTIMLTMRDRNGSEVWGKYMETTKLATLKTIMEAE